MISVIILHDLLNIILFENWIIALQLDLHYMDLYYYFTWHRNINLLSHMEIELLMDLHFAFRISIGRLLYIYNWLMALQIMIGCIT